MVGGQLNPATGKKEGGITVNAPAMEQAALKGYATATDLADYLVKKGLPFRDAHETVAHAVKAATTHATATCQSCRWPCCRAFTPPSRRTCTSA